jgi:hypothetical protein
MAANATFLEEGLKCTVTTYSQQGLKTGCKKWEVAMAENHIVHACKGQGEDVVVDMRDVYHG